MTQIELITSSRVEDLPISNLYGYILDKVENDRIVILEKSLDAQQQMELIALGLERVSKESYAGISFVPFFVTTHVNGRFKAKPQELQFNLIAPASSIIEETSEGVFSVTTKDGNVFSAAF